MKRCRRLVCLLFSLVLLCTLLPPRTAAVGTIYFTSVNDTLLDLSDATMPFWQGGVLYVSGAALDGTDLGIFYSYNREKQVASVYKQRRFMYCDLAAGTIEDNTTHEIYNGSVIVKGDMVFFPINVLASFFGLKYSCTKVSYGYLVRLRNENAELSDAQFIDAATQSFRQRYNQYERAQAAQNDTVNGQTQTTPEQDELPAEQRTAYLCLSMTEAGAAASVLNALDGASGRATLLFAPDMFDGMDDVARRAAATGHALALEITETETAAAALEQIERGNAALWLAASVKTRLVYLPEASGEVAGAVAKAGYYPIGVQVQYLPRSGGVTAADRIVARVDAYGGSCRIYVGADTDAARWLPMALNRMRAENCTVSALNEVTA